VLVYDRYCVAHLKGGGYTRAQTHTDRHTDTDRDTKTDTDADKDADTDVLGERREETRNTECLFP